MALLTYTIGIKLRIFRNFGTDFLITKSSRLYFTSSDQKSILALVSYAFILKMQKSDAVQMDRKFTFIGAISACAFYVQKKKKKKKSKFIWTTLPIASNFR